MVSIFMNGFNFDACSLIVSTLAFVPCTGGSKNARDRRVFEHTWVDQGDIPNPDERQVLHYLAAQLAHTRDEYPPISSGPAGSNPDDGLARIHLAFLARDDGVLILLVLLHVGKGRIPREILSFLLEVDLLIRFDLAFLAPASISSSFSFFSSSSADSGHFVPLSARQAPSPWSRRLFLVPRLPLCARFRAAGACASSFSWRFSCCSGGGSSLMFVLVIVL